MKAIHKSVVGEKAIFCEWDELFNVLKGDGFTETESFRGYEIAKTKDSKRVLMYRFNGMMRKFRLLSYKIEGVEYIEGVK